MASEMMGETPGRPVVTNGFERPALSLETVQWLEASELLAAFAVDAEPTVANYVRLGLTQLHIGKDEPLARGLLDIAATPDGYTTVGFNAAVYADALACLEAGEPRLARQSLDCIRPVDDGSADYRAYALHVMGRVALAEHKPVEATRCFRQAQGLWKIAGAGNDGGEIRMANECYIRIAEQSGPVVDRAIRKRYMSGMPLADEDRPLAGAPTEVIVNAIRVLDIMAVTGKNVADAIESNDKQDAEQTDDDDEGEA